MSSNKFALDISLVIPAYNEEGAIEKLHRELTKVLTKVGRTYEIVFIDDGSTDNTLKKLIKLRKKDSHVKVLAFTQNHGKSAALMAGFNEAKGEIIFTMDADLQDDPKEIPKFIAKIEKGYDMVTGWKFVRHDPKAKTIPSKFFNWLTSKISGAQVHDSNCGYKAYRREAAKQLRIHQGFHRYIPAILQWKGWKIGEIKVEHHPRTTGVSKYGWERLIKGIMDLIVLRTVYGKGDKPMYTIGPFGIAVGALGGLGCVGITILTLLELGPGNYTPLLILSSFLMLLGLNMFLFGLFTEMFLNSRTKGDEYTLKKV